MGFHVVCSLAGDIIQLGRANLSRKRRTGEEGSTLERRSDRRRRVRCKVWRVVSVPRELLWTLESTIQVIIMMTQSSLSNQNVDTRRSMISKVGG